MFYCQAAAIPYKLAQVSWWRRRFLNLPILGSSVEFILICSLIPIKQRARGIFSHGSAGELNLRLLLVY